MNHFNELQLPVALHQALQAMKFEKPTPIQAQAIPLALQGSDLIGCAQTGTGKTAAFGIPLVTQLLQSPGKIALVLAPTRELAVQIESVLKALLSRCPQFKTALLIGGSSMQPQLRQLQKRPQVLVATPGRLLDHLDRRSVDLSRTAVLVLDEADRMLDMGFAPQLGQILRHLPKGRQTLLFSATWPEGMDQLAAKYLHDPKRVTVGTTSRPAEKIKQSVIQTTGEQKKDVLLDALNERQGSVLIFTKTKHRTDRIARFLSDYGHSVTRIHGDRSQGQRNAAINGFKSGEFRIMVATDIAARGLDISHIAHVINFDLPQVPEDYIHRIGRTGRAGASGEALCILLPEDREQWRRISRLMPGSTGAQTPVAGGALQSAASAGARAASGRPNRSQRSRRSRWRR